MKASLHRCTVRFKLIESREDLWNFFLSDRRNTNKSRSFFLRLSSGEKTRSSSFPKEWEGMKESTTRQANEDSTLTRYSISSYGQGNSISHTFEFCFLPELDCCNSLNFSTHRQMFSHIIFSFGYFTMRKRRYHEKMKISSATDWCWVVHLPEGEMLSFERITLCITNGICISYYSTFLWLNTDTSFFRREIAGSPHHSTGTSDSRDLRQICKKVLEFSLAYTRKLNNLTFNLQFFPVDASFPFFPIIFCFVSNDWMLQRYLIN